MLEYAARAVELAGMFDPGHPSWAGATALVMHDPFLRDLLIVQMIFAGTQERAVLALQGFPGDPAGNCDAVLVAALWLSGMDAQAAAVAESSGNRSAQLIGVLAATGIPVRRWADAMVAELASP